MNKWHTFDTYEGEASNQVICPDCTPVLKKHEPSVRELTNQNPDPTMQCIGCDKQWEYGNAS